MIYGYCRVSTKEQNLDRQIKAMHDFGIEDRFIVTDKQSGKSFDRRGFNQLVGTAEVAPLLRPGDLLVVYSIDRFGRNYQEIRQMWQHITKELEADIKVIDMPLLDTRVGDKSLDKQFVADLVLQILSYVADKERMSIRSRQREGYDAMLLDEKGRRVSAKTGRHVGKQEIQRPDNFDRVLAEWKAGQITAVDAMKQTGIKRSTFYKMLKEDGVSVGPGVRRIEKHEKETP